MARIEWALLCELALLDHHEHLSMFGITTSFPAPSLPLAIDKIMMVAKLLEVRQGDKIDVGVAISTPCGKSIQPMSSGFDVEEAGEYLFVTLYGVPIAEAGTHHFALGIGQQEVALEIPVTLISKPMSARSSDPSRDMLSPFESSASSSGGVMRSRLDGMR